MRDQLDLPARPVLFLDEPANAARTWAKVAAWLQAGASTAAHPFRRPVATTIGPDGFPESRTVILRRFDEPDRKMIIHTDVRSPKGRDLRRDPRCGFLLYDSERLLQLRVRTDVTLHHADDLARSEFADLLPHTRASYAHPVPPGAELAPDAPFDYPPRPPVDEQVAFENFLAVVCVIREIDVLELHEHGHRRAQLWWDGETRIRRVAP